MDFRFSDEQRQFQESLERFLRKDYGFERRREIARSDAGYSTEVWAQFAEMGVLALTLPEAHDGFGGGAFDTLLVMEALGRANAVEPYLSTVVLGASLIAQAGSDAQRGEILPAVAAGTCKLALAHGEAGNRYELEAISTTAKTDGDGYVLNGAKAQVLHGGAADRLLVSARTRGSAREAGGISLFLVDAKAPGLACFSYPTQDGQRAANLTFQDVRVPKAALVGPEHGALPLIEAAMDRAIAALCAEAVGNMAALIEATVGYLKTRKQFGVPIGSFQALQHRAVDMYLHAEQARSMAYLAAARVDGDDAAARRHAVSAAKVLVGQSARFVGQQAVQLHGGIGVTEELAVSHYFKRLTMITLAFGDIDHHLDRVGRASLAAAA
ncbi:MAG TPA: acyl-CoA dehydrogenase family protein [Solimonas sp.]